MFRFADKISLIAGKRQSIFLPIMLLEIFQPSADFDSSLCIALYMKLLFLIQKVSISQKDEPATTVIYPTLWVDAKINLVQLPFDLRENNLQPCFVCVQDEKIVHVTDIVFATERFFNIVIKIVQIENGQKLARHRSNT